MKKILLAFIFLPISCFATVNPPAPGASSGGGGGGGGTVTQGTQASSPTGNTWYTQEVKLDSIISNGYLSITATSLPLPTGAATSANQTPPVSAGTNSSTAMPIQGVVGGVAQNIQSQPIAASACITNSVVIGGTAVTFISGPINGGWITNPLSASDQNIATSEVEYVNLVTTATTNGRGTNDAIQPGQVYIIPALKTGQSVSVVAATSGHASSCRTY